MKKKPFPHLKIRSAYSYRRAFGNTDQIAARLAEIGVSFGALVDTGTWGHVYWEKSTKKAGIIPGFGREFSIEVNGVNKPCWCLMENSRDFYRFSSSNPHTPSDFSDSRGLIRFSGAALTDPEFIDYIDISPLSPIAAKEKLALSKRINRPIVLIAENRYPAPHHIDHYEAIIDRAGIAPQWILSENEIAQEFAFLSRSDYRAGIRTAFEISERLAGVSLARAPIISVEGDLSAMIEVGRRYRLENGHIKKWTDEYQQRLNREIELIKSKNYESYFIVVSDLVVWAKSRMLVGPGRGSSAGSLVCYLLRITEVDPLIHNLMFERFIDITRSDLPDIDIDFSDKSRALVFEYLSDKYGGGNTARLGNISTLQARSVMTAVAKNMGINIGATFPVRNALIEYSSGDSRYGKGLLDTLELTQPGKDFIAEYPEAIIMGEIEGHADHSSVHAAGVLVCHEPVNEFCTVIDGIAQVDKPAAEYLNLLKIDALGLSTLGIIEDCHCVDSETLYGLSLDDQAVLKIFNDQKFCGIFQFEGQAQRKVSQQINIESFKQIDHITALARPGPLMAGATTHYQNINKGIEKVKLAHPILEEYTGDTKGQIIYQEQVMQIARKIGKLPWEIVSELRKAMSGSKGEEYFNRRGAEFVKGAMENGLTELEAITIWKSIVTFGSWAMNMSHTVSYSIISYWCAWMKRYHPLEFAAALLRHESEDEKIIAILRELKKEGIEYEAFNIDLSQPDWSCIDGKLIGGFKNIRGIGPVKAANLVQLRDSGKLEKKHLSMIEKNGVKYSDLSPAHTLWGDYYRNPDYYGIGGAIYEAKQLKDGQNAVIIGLLIGKKIGNMNEPIRVAKRGGKILPGNQTFLDLKIIDDSIDQPVRARISPKYWETYGRAISDWGLDGKDWFLFRGRWLEQFNMLSIEKARCLTNPELFNKKT